MNNESTQLQKSTKTEESFVPLDIILSRDMIFMEWGVRFGSQILGLILGIVLGYVFGINMWMGMTGESEALKTYAIIEIAIGLCFIGLSIYYAQKMGVKINFKKDLTHNKLYILKILLFSLSWILGLSFIYNSYVAPWATKVSGADDSQTGNGNGGENADFEIDLGTTNDFLLYVLAIFIVVALTAILYAGLLYGINKKIKTQNGVTVLLPTILLTFLFLSPPLLPSAFLDHLFTGKFSIFFMQLIFFFLLAFIAILSYHLSGRIEIAIITTFLAFALNYGSPSTLLNSAIIIKWGFPNYSDGVTTIQDVIFRTIDYSQIAGLFGMIVYPIIFYQDTINFGKRALKTVKKQLLPITGFFIVNFVIEIIISFLANLLSFFFYLIAFIIIVSIVNSIISSKYGKKSYTALLQTLESAVKINEPLIPSFDKRIEMLEINESKKEKTFIIMSTLLPIVIYFVLVYITTSITNQNTFWEILFFIFILPLAIAFSSFAITFFFKSDPLIKNYYSYPVKAVSIASLIVFYIVSFNRLVYTNTGLFPLFALFFAVLIYIPIKTRKSIGELILYLASEKREKTIKKLDMKEKEELNLVEEKLYEAPIFLQSILVILLSKKGSSPELLTVLDTLLKSSFETNRSIASLCLLYLNNQESRARLIDLLENDDQNQVRESIAYGFRYMKHKLDEELFKRLIDSQHYEENPRVLETLKKTIGILEQRFARNKEEKELEEIFID